MDLECYRCGGPAELGYSDGLYDLCPMCSAERDDYRYLTPLEEEELTKELFKDSDISLEEWIDLIVNGPED